MKTKFLTILLILSFIFFASSCKKYLDAKSDQSLVTINSLDDMQSIMDNFDKINQFDAAADITSADEYYLTSSDYESLFTEFDRNMYVWHPTNLWDEYKAIANDWGGVYNSVYKANTILTNISNVQRTVENASQWDNVKGQAHFLRAYALFKASEIWCLAYDENTSSTDLGLPLRLDPDLNISSSRSSNKETYSQIIGDVEKAIELLPISPLHVSRASKPAAYAFLSRIYLAMRDYKLALSNANDCLKLSNSLIDYNNLDELSSYPIAKFNKEVLYHSTSIGFSGVPVDESFAKIDTVLFGFYNDNDLRKIILYRNNEDGSKTFKGSYDGSYTKFYGIATDEIYLIRAECYARMGELTEAMSDLNNLLINRYRKGTFQTLTSLNETQILSLVLLERRKELVMRGNRWTDIKRLNKEGMNITLKRILNGTEYSLPPNDLRFALPIPEDIIQRSGMQQNPR